MPPLAALLWPAHNTRSNSRSTPTMHACWQHEDFPWEIKLMILEAAVPCQLKMDFSHIENHAPGHRISPMPMLQAVDIQEWRTLQSLRGVCQYARRIIDRMVSKQLVLHATSTIDVDREDVVPGDIAAHIEPSQIRDIIPRFNNFATEARLVLEEVWGQHDDAMLNAMLRVKINATRNGETKQLSSLQLVWDIHNESICFNDDVLDAHIEHPCPWDGIFEAREYFTGQTELAYARISGTLCEASSLPLTLLGVRRDPSPVARIWNGNMKMMLDFCDEGDMFPSRGEIEEEAECPDSWMSFDTLKEIDDEAKGILNGA